jgi:hypothetical protein
LYFKLIGHPFALQLPVILTHRTHNNLLVLINRRIRPMLLTIVHLLFLAHLNLVHHLIPIIDLLVSLVWLFLLQVPDLLVFGFLEVEVLALEGLRGQLVQD